MTNQSVLPTVEPGRVAVLIPTYNEKETLPLIVERVRRTNPQVDIVVLDDNSPDGTGDIADDLAASDPHVLVLHRKGKEGLGAAYLHGFREALSAGYDFIVEMDADGSHQPEHLPAMLKAADNADLVIGSRYVKGGSIVNWPFHRKALSIGGNIYIKIVLGMPVNDVTAGYRVYRAEALRMMDLQDVASSGYCFQSDLTRRAVRRGLRVTEVPITFIEREIGQSKMSGNIMKETLRNITVWGIEDRKTQLRKFFRREKAWQNL